MLQQIKFDTQALHQRVENLTFSREISAGKLTYEQYILLLQTNHDWLYYLEGLIAKNKQLAQNQSIEWNKRSKLNLLKNEIQQRGFQVVEPLVRVYQSFSQHELLGCLYVMEGASLGGMYIQKQLAKHPKISRYPMKFYGYYAKETAQMWKKLKAYLTEQITNQVEYQQVISGVTYAYQEFERSFLYLTSSALQTFELDDHIQ